MASIVWNRDPQEAMNHPYEYNAQKQFHRESLALTEKLSKAILNKNNFTLNDQTLEKATWMLQTDALYGFKDAVELLELKKHKVVGRLLRDVLETLNLIEYLNSGYASSNENLVKWYNDETIPNRRYRDYIKNTVGEAEHEYHKHIYSALSNFTHRTYKSLLYGYIGRGDSKLFYDEQWTIPGTVAMYYALLGWLGRQLIKNLKTVGVLTSEEVDECWGSSMDAFQIPRGYHSEEDKKFLGIEDE